MPLSCRFSWRVMTEHLLDKRISSHDRAGLLVHLFFCGVCEDTFLEWSIFKKYTGSPFC
jgi:hypothetical protein